MLPFVVSYLAVLSTVHFKLGSNNFNLDAINVWKSLPEKKTVLLKSHCGIVVVLMAKSEKHQDG